jgi:DNA-binding IclR family transcriptional regulator
LVEGGALERASTGGYRIGLRLWEMGSLAPRGARLGKVILPFMQDLYDATHENVHLGVLDGHEVLYIERITGRRSSTVRSRRGERLPLHATGAGQVLLAYAPPHLQREVMEAGLRRYTPHTIVAPGLLQQALAQIRRTGVAVARECVTVGRVSVAAPILDAAGAAIAALSLVAVAAGTDVQRLIPAVRATALSASRQVRALELEGAGTDHHRLGTATH